MYYFLKEDFEALNAEINKIADKIKEIGKEMGKSCQEGAETFHDNFAYEDGERQQYMWSGRIRELIRIPISTSTFRRIILFLFLTQLLFPLFLSAFPWGWSWAWLILL